jgi:hypothetical protein
MGASASRTARRITLTVQSGNQFWLNHRRLGQVVIGYHLPVMVAERAPVNG